MPSGTQVPSTVDRLPDPVARERVVRPHHVGQRHRVGVGQVGGLGGAVRLPGVELPEPQADGHGHQHDGEEVRAPVPRGELAGHVVRVRRGRLSTVIRVERTGHTT